MEYTRYRSSGSLTGTLQGYRFRHFPGTCTPSPAWDAWSAYDTTPAEFGEKRTISDTVTPGYFRKRQKGTWLPVNYLSTNLRRVTSQGTSDLTETFHTSLTCTPSVKNQYEYQGRLVPRLIPAYLGGYYYYGCLEGDRVARVKKELATSLFADRQKGTANYVESLAEIDKSFRMLINPLENLSTFSRNFRSSRSYKRLMELRKKFPGKRRNSPLPKGSGKKSVEIRELILLWASEWLRFRYGIKPLISDIQAGVKAWKADYSDKKAVFHTVRKNRSVTANKLTTVVFADANQRNTYARLNTELLQLRYFWTDEYAPSAFNDLGLTFHNVVGVAWELTRFSFVADWFVNIGDLIYANIPRVFVTPKGGGQVVIRTLTNQCFLLSAEDLQPAVYTRSGSVADSVLLYNKAIDRRGLTLNEGIGLVINDDFRLDHFTRASDALSLVAQQFSQTLRGLR